MSITTLLRFLVGSRSAILEIAGSRLALLVGAVFVFTAGLAREYLRTDLLYQPWHLLIPFAVSVAAAAGLWILACFSLSERTGTAPTFLQLMSLTWATAPLALIYAIPWEYFLSSYAAATARLYSLAIVSVARVVLTGRFMSVLTGRRFLLSFAMVMLPCDLLALIALNWLPFPIIDVMGGIPLQPEDMALRGVAANVVLVGGLTLLPWFVMAIIAVGKPLDYPEIKVDSRPGRWSGLLAALTACAGLLCALPITQPPVRRARLAEVQYATLSIPDYLQALSATHPGEFPPHWRPPPRIRGADDITQLLTLMKGIDAASGWVRTYYIQEFERVFMYWGLFYIVQPELVAEALEQMNRLPEGSAILSRHKEQLEYLMNRLAMENPPATTRSTTQP